MKCPNCSKEIKRFDLSPNCKNCGVNIFYSQQKTLLSEDAKMCELEFAGFRIIVAKLKASFIKGLIPILRIVAMVVAIGAIFVPFAEIKTAIPIISEVSFSFGAWGIYSAFTNGVFEGLLNVIDYAPQAVYISLALLASIVVIFLMGFSIFVCLLLSFINIQKTARIMRYLSAVGSAVCIASAIISLVMPSVVAKSGFLIAKTGFGAFVCFAVLAFIFLLNHLVIKKNIQPEIKEVDIKRVEMGKKVKSGEVLLKDLPLPVFETEEEKEKRLQDEASRKAEIEKAKGGESLG